MISDQQLEKLISEQSDEKIVSVLRELLLERKNIRLQINQLMEARDLYKRQCELGNVLSRCT